MPLDIITNLKNEKFSTNNFYKYLLVNNGNKVETFKIIN